MDQTMAGFICNYKVFFEGNPTAPMVGLSLTFLGLSDIKKISEFPNFTVKFNELARRKQYSSFGNIKEVLPLNPIERNKLNQFHVLLYSIKEESKIQRTGLLIANHKDHGFVVLGIWPMISSKENIRIPENYDKILNQIVIHPEKFIDCLLIS
jgi:hypothetical protein